MPRGAEARAAFEKQPTVKETRGMERARTFTPTCCCVSFSLSMTGVHTALGRLRMTYGELAFSNAGRTRPNPSRPAPKCA